MATTSELTRAISAACLASQRAQRARAEHAITVEALRAAGYGELLEGLKVRKAAIRAALAAVQPNASADAFIKWQQRRATLGPTSTINDALRAWGRPIAAKVTP